MGEEITTSHFGQNDFMSFKESLTHETGLLENWFNEQAFDVTHGVGGFELEAWIVDKYGTPLAINEQMLKLLDNPLAVPELAMFNLELNGPPYQLRGNALSQIHSSLAQTWERCEEVAQSLGAALMMIGILPTVREEELTLRNMSHRWRYRALNEQILSLREGSPFKLNIQGKDKLHTTHTNVMLEAATTSLQIHLQVSPDKAVRFYNAASILSAPMVAVCANSPYLFGKDLWAETRIPLFEQAITASDTRSKRKCGSSRVSFGSSYTQESLLELFIENREHFPVLLPIKFYNPPEALNHLRLHNGTIWRWNRPIVGFGDYTGKFTEGDTPHLRIEHRVVSAGPSVVDCIANAALFFGLAQFFGTREIAPESQLSFQEAASNFYAAAKLGLEAKIRWLGGQTIGLKTLFMEELLSLARQGLQQLELTPSDIDFYLGIIQARVITGQNGSVWQRTYLNKHRCNMQELTIAYLERQQSGQPVHEWTI